MYLPYIYQTNSLCYTNSSLPVVATTRPISNSVKIADNGLNFYFYFLFYFVSFSFLFFFYFQNSLGQGLSVMLSHQSQLDGVVTRLIMGHKRRKQKVLEQSDVIQYGQYMLASCYTHGHLGQGAQQLARTMGTSI